jgi:hypothetical protein
MFQGFSLPVETHEKKGTFEAIFHRMLDMLELKQCFKKFAPFLARINIPVRSCICWSVAGLLILLLFPPLFLLFLLFLVLILSNLRLLLLQIVTKTKMQHRKYRAPYSFRLPLSPFYRNSFSLLFSPFTLISGSVVCLLAGIYL